MDWNLEETASCASCLGHTDEGVTEQAAFCGDCIEHGTLDELSEWFDDIGTGD